MGQLSYEEFLRIFEHDDVYPIDETYFHFESEPREEHFLGCLREYEKPYRAWYCDITDGAEFFTAAELLEAPIYGGRSIKDRWREIVDLSANPRTAYDKIFYHAAALSSSPGDSPLSSSALHHGKILCHTPHDG